MTAPHLTTTTVLGDPTVPDLDLLVSLGMAYGVTVAIAGSVVGGAVAAVFLLGARWERRRPGGTADQEEATRALADRLAEADAAAEQARRDAAAHEHRAGRQYARATALGNYAAEMEATVADVRGQLELTLLDLTTEWAEPGPT